MNKKVIAAGMAMVLASIGLAACSGSGSKEAKDSPDETYTVTMAYIGDKKEDTDRIEKKINEIMKKDINMELDDGYLKISAEKKSDSEEKDGKKYVRRERHCYSKCERQFYVGNIKDEDIKAKFKDGILKISVPKEEEKEETKKVIMIED